jgi:peroxiredoxin family protein
MSPETLTLSRADLSADVDVNPKRLALIVSKGTLDQAYPPLIMATTAASMGWEVGVFFTFYGLDIIQRKKLPKLAVSPVGNPAMPPPLKRFPVRIPTMIGALPGMKSMATGMMKRWLARGHLAPITELIEIARELGVRLYACNTTLAVMGVNKDDLLEGIEFAGAPAFLDFAGDADVQLFI